MCAYLVHVVCDVVVDADVVAAAVAVAVDLFAYLSWKVFSPHPIWLLHRR